MPTKNTRNPGKVPLIVDLDGTLLNSDLLWEGLVSLLSKRPARVVGLVPALFRGRPFLKRFVHDTAGLQAEVLPLNTRVIQLIAEAKRTGRPVLLASGAEPRHVEAVRQRVHADGVLCGRPDVNFVGRAKLASIREQFREFDYVGNSRADLPLLKEARHAYLVGGGPFLRRSCLSSRPDVVLVERDGPGRWGAWLAGLRLHQWSKNLLLFVPALAAHLAWTGSLWSRLAVGFLAFSSLASGLYILNDLVDLPHDRAHDTKRHRPLAAGAAGIPAALLTSAGLLVVSGLLAIMLPRPFGAALIVYAVVTLGYSFGLKRIAVLDVIILASLYTVRIVAGATAAEIDLTQWFLAFSIFLFLSLALVKRATELRARDGSAGEEVPGRGYQSDDAALLLSAGLAASLVSTLVYCLYITGDDVRLLYGRPDVLWAGLPILLYWQLRVWLMASRGRMHDDPVVFALKDRASYAALACLLAVVWLAT